MKKPQNKKMTASKSKLIVGAWIVAVIIFAIAAYYWAIDIIHCGNPTQPQFENCRNTYQECDKQTPDWRRDVCFSGLGKYYPPRCQEVRDSQEKDNCVYQGAKNLGEYEYCADIRNLTIRNTCLQSIAIKLNYSDMKICEKMEKMEGTGWQEAKDGCTYNTAVQLGIDGYCAKLGTQNYLDKCLSNSAIKNANRTLCDEIVGASMKEWCIDRVTR